LRFRNIEFNLFAQDVIVTMFDMHHSTTKLKPRQTSAAREVHKSSREYPVRYSGSTGTLAVRLCPPSLERSFHVEYMEWYSLFIVGPEILGIGGKSG